MENWKNKSGKPLSSMSWLRAHNTAKQIERNKFAVEILKKKPKRIVDLGCGPGFWMETISEVSNYQCEIIGIDSDETSLKLARESSTKWKQSSSFLKIDLLKESDQLPKADMYLAFNLFPYINEPVKLLNIIQNRLSDNGCLVIRQYDGNTIRFGPMPALQRLKMDQSLHAAVSNSRNFGHYDMDKVFEYIHLSKFSSLEINFEKFARSSPYPDEFLDYFKNTVQWTIDYLNEESSNALENWLEEHLLSNQPKPSYFTGLDLVAILS